MNEIIDISKIKIIDEYFTTRQIKDYKYSESLFSPAQFLLTKNTVDEDILDVDEIVKNKEKIKIFIIMNGLGNKLFALANLIN
jgi:hypothetical protein